LSTIFPRQQQHSIIVIIVVVVIIIMIIITISCVSLLLNVAKLTTQQKLGVERPP